MPVNCHALNDFRSGAGNDAVMDEVLSDNVAALVASGVRSRWSEWRRMACAYERMRERPRAGVRRGCRSPTEVDASNMKMGDGGCRPACNLQFATDCTGQVIVGVDAVTAGSEMGATRAHGGAG
ncbi:MAG: hypothetical protein C0505_02890 [Leptothrix sp. (in: Bacteria)]|nr:hypothetical protein [Leptothrix sp. (in: b-proteobacteria)]